jgi:hypothetical protein
MKSFKIIVFASFIFWSATLHAQTVLEAGIGVGFSKIEGYSEEEYSYYGIVPHDGFETRSPFLHFGVNQNITNRLSLKAGFEFGVENVAFIDYGFAGWTDLRFDHYNFLLVPQYTIFKNVEIGFGVSYGILSDYELGKKERNIWNPTNSSYNQKHIGWITSLNYNLRPVTIALQYRQTTDKHVDQNKLVHQINSIEALLSYQFSVGSK